MASSPETTEKTEALQRDLQRPAVRFMSMKPRVSRDDQGRVCLVGQEKTEGAA